MAVFDSDNHSVVTRKTRVSFIGKATGLIALIWTFIAMRFSDDPENPWIRTTAILGVPSTLIYFALFIPAALRLMDGDKSLEDVRTPRQAVSKHAIRYRYVPIIAIVLIILLVAWLVKVELL